MRKRAASPQASACLLCKLTWMCFLKRHWEWEQTGIKIGCCSRKPMVDCADAVCRGVHAERQPGDGNIARPGAQARQQQTPLAGLAQLWALRRARHRPRPGLSACAQGAAELLSSIPGSPACACWRRPIRTKTTYTSGPCPFMHGLSIQVAFNPSINLIQMGPRGAGCAPGRQEQQCAADAVAERQGRRCGRGQGQVV